jgi:hypothetical protein
VLALLQMHVHIKRHLMKDLPETDEAVAQWCRDIFTAKVPTNPCFKFCIHLSNSYANLKCLSYAVGNEIVALKQLHILDP